MIPDIPGFTLKFSKIAEKHNFKMTKKIERKVRNLVAKTKTPFFENDANLVCNIPCKYKEHKYTREIYQY